MFFEVEVIFDNEKNIFIVDKRWFLIVIINGLWKSIFLFKIFGLKFGGFNLLFFRWYIKFVLLFELNIENRIRIMKNKEF